MSFHLESDSPRNRARVLLDGKVDLIFDYGIPVALERAAVIGVRVRIPVRNRTLRGIILEIVPDDGTVPGLRDLQGVEEAGNALSLQLVELGKWLADYYLCPLVTMLAAMSPGSVRTERDGFREILRIALAVPMEEAAAALPQLLKKAPRQAEALGWFLDGLESASLAELEQKRSGCSAAVRALIQKGLLRKEKSREMRDPLADEEFVSIAPPVLTEGQSTALAAIQSEFAKENPRPVLLHGVTGSGKTEVYLRLLEENWRLGKSAIVLVPEISLAPQTAARIKSRFAEHQDQIAVLHSGLSAGEWHDEWHKLRAAPQSIAIGPRSAAFAPVNNLGLVIVDEEHEVSYKQDQTPRYHGRDTVIVRARLENCPVLLASATPSLETYRHALDGKFGLVPMPDRVDGRSLPLIRVVDLRLGSTQRLKGSDNAMFSPKLRDAIEQRLERGEQSILFLNRRGFSRVQMCGGCGFTTHCDHCSVPMPFHKSDGLLICHICGFRRVPLKHCPECAEGALGFGGYGTEKVEELARRLFPQARIARVDSDTMRRKGRLRETLRAFAARKLDLLVGTQMIAKGLDFPNVTLVGVLNADTALHMPDFRAAERTFQQLVQVAGRAGRGEMEGEVIVQTFQPHCPAIQYARHHDYTGFADEEMESRKQHGLPPFQRAALIRGRSENEALLEHTMEKLVMRQLRKIKPERVWLGEAAPAPLERSHGQFHWQVMCLAGGGRRMGAWLRNALQEVGEIQGVSLSCDIDPMGFS